MNIPFWLKKKRKNKNKTAMNQPHLHYHSTISSKSPSLWISQICRSVKGSPRYSPPHLTHHFPGDQLVFDRHLSFDKTSLSTFLIKKSCSFFIHFLTESPFSDEGQMTLPMQHAFCCSTLFLWTSSHNSCYQPLWIEPLTLGLRECLFFSTHATKAQ